MSEVVVHINRPRAWQVFRTDPDDRPTRWCFKCRKRLRHTWSLEGEPMPTWYDPMWILRCSGCRGSCTRFPGT